MALIIELIYNKYNSISNPRALKMTDNFVWFKQEKPGSWIESAEGAKVWQGNCSWETKHGISVCSWLFGEPHRVWNAQHSHDPSISLLVENVNSFCGNGWRTQQGNRWIYGTVLLEEDTIYFDPYNPQPNLTTTANFCSLPDLYHAISNDRKILEKLKNNLFAQALYASFCNVDWVHSKGKRWNCSWRRAGAIVAELRGLGEIYVDFYCSGITDSTVPEGTVTPEVSAALLALGWSTISEHASKEDHLFAVQQIIRLGKKRKRPMPKWYLERMLPKENWQFAPNTWSGKLHVLGATGKTSQTEWMDIWQKIDLDRDDEPIENLS